MNASVCTEYESLEVLDFQEVEKPAARDNEIAEAFTELERGVQAALETYSNVHRGSGHNSLVTTQLYEQARDIVLEYLGLSKDRYTIVFCTPRRAEAAEGATQAEELSTACRARTLACRWASERWRSIATRCPAAFLSRPVAGRRGWFHPAGSSGPDRRTNSRPARPPSSTSSRLPKHCD